MGTVKIPEVVLNSGHKMPVVGLGTAASPLPPPDELTSILVNAIEVGYRHIDTAQIYGSEESLGRAVAEALKRGLIKSRDELFITSKLWCTDADHDLVLPTLQETLRKLGVSYVDLYLIHWPVRIKHGVQKFEKDQLLPFDIKGTWEAMENCSKLGLAKSVGVSNFSSRKLSQVLEDASIPPAVNQIELHVAWRQQKLREFCKERGIHVSAYSPLAANGASWGSLAVVESPVLKDIAASKQKILAQVALRWVFEQEASIIVKSFNKERMKQNLQIFDLQLTNDEVDQIEQIPQKQGVTGDWCVDPNGQYKSVKDLWDGDNENS